VGQLAINSTDDSDLPLEVEPPAIAVLGGTPHPITVNSVGAGPATLNGFLITPP
jgi:hypothetical protein